ncbi:MAG TPA: alpha/beta hydrolase [Candidatus Methylacidiphilales bacterium]
MPSLRADSPDLADLAQHRERWPAKVTLKAPLVLDIEIDGRKAGTMPAAEGSEVDLVEVTPDGLVVALASARGKAAPEQTDLAERLAPAEAAAPAPAASAPSSAPAATTAPAPPPAAAAPKPAEAAAVVLDSEYPAAENWTKAAFRYWCPAYAGEAPLRAVLVLVPGANGDGRGMAGDKAWQDFARKYRMAVVACFMQGTDGGGPAYHAASRGTGALLLRVLRDFAAKSGRPEVETAPLVMWGHSAGGQFDYNFALWKPERVAAFVVNKGGYYEKMPQTGPFREVPALFFMGEKDADYRVKAIGELWKEGRSRGAPWALAVEPGAAHEPSWTAAAARIFFDDVLPLRLPEDGSTKLKPIAEADGWTGDLTSHEVKRGATSADRGAAWLPGEASAGMWKRFVSGEKQ